MGSRSRRKGAGWEVEVAHRIEDATGHKAARTLSECREGNSGDIQCAGLPIVWQCKVGARPDIYAAVREADEVAEPKAYFAVAVTKRNGSRHESPVELATLPLDQFLELLNLLIAVGAWSRPPSPEAGR